MADETDVAVKIVGKLDSSMQASVDAAKAQLNSFSKQAQLTSADIKAAMGGNIRSYADVVAGIGALTQSQTDAAAAAGILKTAQVETARAVQVTAAVTDGLSISQSRLSRSAIVLAHALVTGQYSRIPGELMVASEAFGGLSLSVLGVAGAAAATVAGLGYLVYETIEAERETTRLAAAFELTGRGATVNRGFIEQQVDVLRQTADISETGAQKLLAWESADARFTSTFINSANQIYGIIKSAYGDQAETVFKQLVTQIAGLTEHSLPELNEKFLNLTPAQYEVVDGMLRIGDVTGAQQQIFHDLADRGGRSIEDIKTQIGKLEHQAIELTATMNVMATSASEGAAVAAGQIAAQVAKIEDKLKGLRAEEKDKEKSQSDTDQAAGIAAARAINAEYDKRGPILQTLKQLTDTLNRAQASGDTQGAAAAREAIAHEQQKLSDLQISDNEKVYRDFLAKEEAKSAAFKEGSVQRIQIDREVLAEAAKLFGTESTQYAQALSKMRQDQRASAEQQQKLDDDANRQWLAGITNTATQIEQILQHDTEDANQRGRQALADRKRDLDQAVAMRQMSADDELQILIGLYSDEADLEIQRLKAHQQANADDVKIYDQDAQEILRVYQWLFDEINKLQTNSVNQQQKEIDKLTKEYEKQFKPITQGFNSMVRDMLSGQKTFGQAVRDGIAQMLQDAITADLQRVEHWIFSELARATATTEANQLIGASNSSTDDMSLGDHIAATIKSIETDAAKTFAGVFGFFAPSMGPFAAIPAAAATAIVIGAEALLPSLAVGTSNVPFDTLAQIHQGEMIIPKYDADLIRGGELHETQLAASMRKMFESQAYEFGPSFDALRHYNTENQRDSLGDDSQYNHSAARNGDTTFNVTQENHFHNSQSAVMRMMKSRALVRQMAKDIGRHYEINAQSRGKF